MGSGTSITNCGRVRYDSVSIYTVMFRCVNFNRWRLVMFPKVFTKAWVNAFKQALQHPTFRYTPPKAKDVKRFAALELTKNQNVQYQLFLALGEYDGV